jgi:hypothetical protein
MDVWPVAEARAPTAIWHFLDLKESELWFAWLTRKKRI